MKTLATLALLFALASPTLAAVVHDETVHGDLSTDPAAPTPLIFTPGSNEVIGSLFNSGSPADTRDYLRFTVPPGAFLVNIDLVAFSPDNLAFASLNSGTTSFVPGVGTTSNFLSGIHVSAGDIGTDLLEAFVTESVTTFSLPAAILGPGDYVFLIQQTTPILQAYRLDFYLEAPVPANADTWGALKRLYR